MTRETKIGLLVGLAFIIVVGILLSDNMNAAREPAPAPLQIAGSSIRSGLGQPVSDADPAGAGPQTAPATAVPQQPVPTQEEVAPRPPAVAAVIPPPAAGDANSTAASTPATDSIVAAAQQSGEELVDSNGQPITPPLDLTAGTAGAVAAATNARPITLAARSYKAQPGDTLSRIALKLLGSGNKANRAAIVALNVSLKSDPNKIIVGHTYAIPAAATPVTVASAASAASAARDVSGPKPQPTAAPTHIYTVKPGDSLWSIAVNQLGDPSTMAAIKDLNPKLSTRGLRPKMKIILPEKPVASAE
jgi:LysM repeat protein